MLLCALVFTTGGCGGGPAPPPVPAAQQELLQLSSSARLAFERGDVPQAVTLYQRALAKARAADEAPAIASAAYNLAACHLSLGQYARARELLREARAEAVRAGGSPADIVLLDAKAARSQGADAEAMAIGDQLLTDATLGAGDSHRMQVHLLKARISIQKRDLATARLSLDKARELEPGVKSSALAASLAELTGRALLLENQPAQAAEHLDRAAGQYKESRLYREMAQATAAAAGAWRDAGKKDLAAGRYYLAARSAFGQGDRAWARTWLALAGELSVAADASLSQRIKSLAGEMEPTTGPATRP
jgi:tetratricopeptide (TPR) repeat protein